MKKLILGFFIFSIIWFANTNLIAHRVPEDMKLALEKFYESNPDVLKLYNDFRIAIDKNKNVQLSYFPSVSLSYSKTLSSKSRLGDNDSDSDHQGWETESKGGRGNMSASIDYLLWNGGSKVWQVKASNMGKESCIYKIKKDEQEFLLNAIEVYVNCACKLMIVRYSSQMLENYETILKESAERYRLGAVPKSDMKQTYAKVESARSKLAKARSEYYASLADYKKTFNALPKNTKLPELPKVKMNIDEVIKTAINRNPGIKASGYDFVAKSYEVQSQIASKLFPRVDLSMKRDFMSGRGQDNQPDSDSNFHKYDIGISCRWEFSPGMMADMRTSDSESGTARYEYIKVVREVEQAAKQAFYSYNAMHASVLALDHQLSALKEVLKMQGESYRLGGVPIAQYLNNEEELLEAETNYVETQKELVMAFYRLQSAMGNLSADYFELQNRLDLKRNYRKNKGAVRFKDSSHNRIYRRTNAIPDIESENMQKIINDIKHEKGLMKKAG